MKFINIIIDTKQITKWSILVMVSVGIVIPVSIVLIILIWKLFLNLVFGVPL